MRKRRHVSDVVAALCLSWAFCGCASTEKPAALSVDSDIDMGVVMHSDPVKVIYLDLKNTGDKDLFVTDVRPDCDCTSVDSIHNPIKGGETQQMKVTLDLTRFFPSSVAKQVVIYTNAPESPSTVTIHGEVRWENTNGN